LGAQGNIIPVLGSTANGVSVWALLLFSSSIFQASRTTPDISIPSTTYRLPTLAIPFVLILLTALLVPHTSILGHICGMVMGFGWGAGYLKFLIPPAKYLRWIEDKLMLRTRLSSSYVDVSLDRPSGGQWGGILPMTGEAIDLEHSGAGNSGIRLGP
jgi:glycosylphosphatidylinositol transamidase